MSILNYLKQEGYTDYRYNNFEDVIMEAFILQIISRAIGGCAAGVLMII